MNSNAATEELTPVPIEEVARWVKHNSVTRGSPTPEQAANIDWVALVARTPAWREA